MRPVSVASRRALSPVLPLALAVLLAGATGAAAQSTEVVGGDALASRGLVVAPTSPAPPADLTATSWLVADLDSGAVLAAKDAHGTYAPASTLKMLTALALEPVVPADRVVVPVYDDVAVEGSKVGLVEGLAYPAEELYSALLMVSGNDAANALATAAGGQERAAGIMNETARRLGALDTRAVNPSGLDAEGQVSSAYDLAVIARAGMAEPAFARRVAARKGSIAAPGGARIEIANHNKLLYNYEGSLGIKNGYTSRARASFVGAAERDGRRLLVSLMRAEPRVWAEAGRLLDWGFSTPAASVVPVGRLVDPVVESAVTPPVAPQAPTAAGEVEAVAATADVPEDEGFPVGGTVTTVLLLAGLVAVRRRQVVVARRRRRRLAARRANERARLGAPQGRPVPHRPPLVPAQPPQQQPYERSTERRVRSA